MNDERYVTVTFASVVSQKFIAQFSCHSRQAGVIRAFASMTEKTPPTLFTNFWTRTLVCFGNTQAHSADAFNLGFQDIAGLQLLLKFG